MTPKKITLRQLRRAGACETQVKLFKETFGSEALLTMANMRKAIAADLSLSWCYHLIPYPYYGAYWDGENSLPERQAYDRLIAEEGTAQRKIWNSFRASENKCDYLTTAWLAARTRRENKLRNLAKVYQPKLAEAKQAYALAHGKLLLKYLRKV